jgi:branched-chain amino acid aminotransferase
LEESGEHVKERQLTVEDILAADEVFLTDVIHGLRWVGAFRKKRYFNNRSKVLLQQLNERQIKKV